MGIAVLFPQMSQTILKVSKKVKPSISRVNPTCAHAGSSLPAAPCNKSRLASSSASSETVPEQRTGDRGKKGQKRKRLMDIKAGSKSSVRAAREEPRISQLGHVHVHMGTFVPAATCESSPPASNLPSAEAISQLKFWKKRREKRNMWTVNHVEETKLRMNKRRRPSYRPKDQEAFYRLLEDPVIQSFLEADIFLRMSDKYLLSMVVEYFGRVGLPGYLYNRIYFFLALYITSDMEDNPTSKQSIFQFLLGKEHWADLYKEFLKLKVELFHAMGHRAWVTPELCEEIRAQNPHHWVWSWVHQCAL
ncbi:putative speedy protein E7 [Trichechus manatus latirostris]|uniref:Speedy protein E7 n=1 Tax=Trichechus manatus latirostris TaxID=127582 RepID=A0A2Y9G175_TRIMA|nr:putative speedy protein E7 [Trichechus manatus latirostris]